MQEVDQEVKVLLENVLWHLDEQEDNNNEEIKLMNAIKRYLLSIK